MSTATFALLCMLAASAEPMSASLPAGWRASTDSELADPERLESPQSFTRVVADFDGDGIDDDARLLKSESRNAEALWVRLSTSGWQELEELDWGQEGPDVALLMGITAVPPGVVAYACFDGAGDCNFGYDRDRPKLVLKQPSIMYFRFGSAASMFFWSRSQERFLKVWISD